MDLIKPKEITLTSQVGGESIGKTFNLGRYPSTEGMYLFGLAIEVLGSAAKPGSSDIVPAKKLQEFAIEICKYVEAEMPSGEFIRLDKKFLIDSHVPDYEMLFRLVREIHDYNSFFFNSGRLLKTSLSLMDQAKLLVTKTLTQFSASSSQKRQPRSKS